MQCGTHVKYGQSIIMCDWSPQITKASFSYFKIVEVWYFLDSWYQSRTKTLSLGRESVTYLAKKNYLAKKKKVLHTIYLPRNFFIELKIGVKTKNWLRSRFQCSTLPALLVLSFVSLKIVNIEELSCTCFVNKTLLVNAAYPFSSKGVVQFNTCRFLKYFYAYHSPTLFKDYNQINSHFYRPVYSLGSCVTLIFLFGTCVILFHNVTKLVIFYGTTG